MPKLTDRFLAALSMDNDRKDRLVFDTVSPGLGVRVTAKGTRRFIVQWTDPVTKRPVRGARRVHHWVNLRLRSSNRLPPSGTFRPSSGLQTLVRCSGV